MSFQRELTAEYEAVETERDQLRAALRALVEKLPNCMVSLSPTTGEPITEPYYGAPQCTRIATKLRVNPGEPHFICCDEHEMPGRLYVPTQWAEALLAAQKLLETTR